MIIQCEKCKKFYDDEFRDTKCPHNTFSANDGWNNFKHHPESYLSDSPLIATEFYEMWRTINEVKKD